MVVVFLLILFAGQAGVTVAAGLRNCDGRCGCCEPSLHRAAAAQAMAPNRHVGAPTQAAGGSMQQMGSSTQGGCCMPSLLSDCGRDQGRSVALISQPPHLGQQAGFSTPAATANTLTAEGRPDSDPYAATLLARATTIPIYLQTAVFLC